MLSTSWLLLAAVLLLAFNSSPLPVRGQYEVEAVVTLANISLELGSAVALPGQLSIPIGQVQTTLSYLYQTLISQINLPHFWSSSPGTLAWSYLQLVGEQPAWTVPSTVQLPYNAPVVVGSSFCVVWQGYNGSVALVVYYATDGSIMDGLHPRRPVTSPPSYLLTYVLLPAGDLSGHWLLEPSYLSVTTQPIYVTAQFSCTTAGDLVPYIVHWNSSSNSSDPSSSPLSVTVAEPYFNNSFQPDAPFFSPGALTYASNSSSVSTATGAGLLVGAAVNIGALWWSCDESCLLLTCATTLDYAVDCYWSNDDLFVSWIPPFFSIHLDVTVDNGTALALTMLDPSQADARFEGAYYVLSFVSQQRLCYVLLSLIENDTAILNGTVWTGVSIITYKAAQSEIRCFAEFNNVTSVNSVLAQVLDFDYLPDVIYLIYFFTDTAGQIYYSKSTVEIVADYYYYCAPGRCDGSSSSSSTAALQTPGPTPASGSGNSSSGSSGGLSGGAIAGITVAAVLIALLLLAVVLRWTWPQSKKRLTSASFDPAAEGSGAVIELGTAAGQSPASGPPSPAASIPSAPSTA